MARAQTVTARPEGPEYRPERADEGEGRRIRAVPASLEFREFTMRGQTAKRTVIHFGYDYDYEQYGKIVPSEPLPESLAWVRDRCADFAGIAPDELVQTLISRYPPIGAPGG